MIQGKHFTGGTPGKKGLQPASFAGFCPDSEPTRLCFVAMKKSLLVPSSGRRSGSCY